SGVTRRGTVGAGRGLSRRVVLVSGMAALGGHAIPQGKGRTSSQVAKRRSGSQELETEIVVRPAEIECGWLEGRQGDYGFVRRLQKERLADAWSDVNHRDHRAHREHRSLCAPWFI